MKDVRTRLISSEFEALKREFASFLKFEFYVKKLIEIKFVVFKIISQFFLFIVSRS